MFDMATANQIHEWSQFATKLKVPVKGRLVTIDHIWNIAILSQSTQNAFLMVNWPIFSFL